ncbi:cubilin-like [Mytilus californianus]|uniref:cubilin-like n=1 Tax=Mytilus californianus TaxID=6549 RepID=UPI0022476093|nr:cubilin-like [Mytilus californianus]
MSKAEPNVYLNNIFVEGRTDDDGVYEECFDTDDQSDYEEVSPVAKKNLPDINIPHNMPKIQSIKEDYSRSKKMHTHLRFLFFINCFVIILVVSNVVTFITTKDKFSEKKTNLTPCAGLIFLNGGSCEVLNGSFNCLCESGFSGRLCEVTPCTGLKCLNGGSCEVLNGTFHCLCDSGFSGRLCKEEIGPCFSNPCFNFGSCRTSCNTFTCYCPNGTKGRRCQDVLHQIITSPGYPSNYNDNMHRLWNIDVGLSNTVRITFTHFELENTLDFVKIYNGQSTTCGSLANYTGTINPTELTSTGRFMTILFTTDGSVAKLGFRAVIYKTTN